MKFSFQSFSDPLCNRKNILFVVTAFICFCIPAMLLTVPGSTSYSFFLLLIFSLIFIFKNRHLDFIEDLKQYNFFVSAMLFWPCLFLIQMAYFKTWNGKGFDLALRMLGSIPIFLLISYTPSDFLKRAHWGSILGGIGAFLFAFYTVYICPHPIFSGRATSLTFNPDPFGGLVLLLSFLSLLSFYDEKIFPKIFSFIKILTFVLGLNACFLSGTRGCWIGIPVLMLITVYYSIRQEKPFLKRKVFTIIVLALISISSALPVISQRFNHAIHDLKNYSAGNQDGSIGHRLILFKSSVNIFLENPIWGVGKGNFQKVLEEYNLSNNQSTTLKDYKYNHAHSDFFHHMVEMGILGIFALMLLYFGPLFHFWKHLHHSDPLINASAYMGSIVIITYGIIALSHTMIDEVRITGFYTLMVTIFLGTIMAKKKEISSSSFYDKC